MTSEKIFNELVRLYPDAHCELNHNNTYELTIAVILSAQTTDISVNKVAPKLFEMYPDVYSLAKANVIDVEECIKSIGLYKNKAKNIIKLANETIERFEGNIPNNMDDLVSLSGIGRKSANVILSECFNVASIAIDTHCERISKRLGLALPNDSVLEVEKKLQKKFKKENWSQLHHLLIFFGRYKCKSQKPDCDNCPFIDICKEKKKTI